MPARGAAAVAFAATALALSPATAQAAVTFGPPQTVPGAVPVQQLYGITTADVDGDGRPDAMVASYDPSAGSPTQLGVLRGRANGTLEPVVGYNLQPGPGGASTSIASGDFNDDGAPDAVLGDAFASSVAVTLNDGVGGFLTATHEGTGASGGTTDVAVGDFDDDGNLDIVSTNGDDSYSILLGNGDGTFAAAQSYSAMAAVPMGVAVGDFDDDGQQDLAISNFFEGSVTLWLGLGDGTFVLDDEIDLDPCTCASPWGIATGDLDDDGIDDVVVTDRFDDRVFTILSDPGGGFTLLGPFDTPPGTNPIAVELGDINGDGFLDAVTANYGDDTASVMLGTGTGSLADDAQVDAGPSPEANAIADLNGDGKLDLLFADQDTGSFRGAVTTLLNISEPAALVGPPATDFGNQAQQTVSAPRSVGVINFGDAPLDVSGATVGGANAGDFLASSDDCTFAPLRPGEICEIPVRFVPTASGARTALLTVQSDDPGGPSTVALQGVGTAAPAGTPGPAGAQGTQGPAGAQGTQGPPAPLLLVLAQDELKAIAGEKLKLGYAATLPGLAKVKAKRRGEVVWAASKTLSAAGTGSLPVKVRKAGNYKLQVDFNADDGQTAVETAQLRAKSG